MKKMNWNELRSLLRKNFWFTFYNNKNNWGRTIKIAMGKGDEENDRLFNFINNLKCENVSVRKHGNGPWTYIMVDIKD